MNDFLVELGSLIMAILGLTVSMAADFCNTLFRAWVVTIIWGWFAVVYLHVAPLGLMEALAVILVSRSVLPSMIRSGALVELLAKKFLEGTEELKSRQFTRRMAAPIETLWVLGMAWIWHLVLMVFSGAQ